MYSEKEKDDETTMVHKHYTTQRTNDWTTQSTLRAQNTTLHRELTTEQHKAQWEHKTLHYTEN